MLDLLEMAAIAENTSKSELLTRLLLNYLSENPKRAT